MKLFLDTASLPDIKQLDETSLIDGITTNPSSLSKIGGDPTRVVRELCCIMKNRPVSIEITEIEPERVYQQAQKIAQIAPNAVVKIPCYQPYYPLIKKLVDNTIAVNITLVFSLAQAVWMSKLGVAYISPFIGRWDDIDVEGTQLLTCLQEMKKGYGYTTNILAASLRTVRHVHAAISAQCDVITLSPDLFRQTMNHPLTLHGMALFEKDWKKLNISTFPAS